MRAATATENAASYGRCDGLALPGTRSGEGTEALWPHMARDELQKMTNRGGGMRESRAAQEVPHPGRRSTDS